MVKSLGIISKLRSFINVSCILNLYYSMVYPYLIYGNIVWANTYPSNLHTLYLLQKRFVRLATFTNSKEASAPLFRKLNIMSIFDINIYQICVFLYRYIYLPSSLPSSFSNFFQFNSQFHSYNTRQADHLHLPFFKTKYGQHSIKYRGVQIWNTKVHIIKSSASLEILKRKLSAHLINDV